MGVPGEKEVQRSRLTPSLWRILRHDVEVGAVAVLVGGLGAPLGVAVGGAQVGDHDGDGVAFARAVALAVGRHVAGVGELVALPASAAAPAAGASEQVLRPGRREDGAAVAGLP